MVWAKLASAATAFGQTTVRRDGTVPDRLTQAWTAAADHLPEGWTVVGLHYAGTRFSAESRPDDWVVGNSGLARLPTRWPPWRAWRHRSIPNDAHGPPSLWGMALDHTRGRQRRKRLNRRRNASPCAPPAPHRRRNASPCAPPAPHRRRNASPARRFHTVIEQIPRHSAPPRLPAADTRSAETRRVLGHA